MLRVIIGIVIGIKSDNDNEFLLYLTPAVSFLHYYNLNFNNKGSAVFFVYLLSLCLTVCHLSTINTYLSILSVCQLLFIQLSMSGHCLCVCLSVKFIYQSIYLLTV